MGGVVRDGLAMVAGMQPVLLPGEFCFCTVTGPAEAEGALATFHEAEGLSVLLPVARAVQLGLGADLPMRQITLQVHSALDGVGLTAAVATALAARGIACNMVAARHHDHVFVPSDRANDAMDVLLDLQARARARGDGGS